jgi:hypothetical protein
MLCRMKVLCCMFIFRTVAATHMAAHHAKTEVYPCVAGLQAIFATVAAWRNRVDLIKMRAIAVHTYSCFPSMLLPPDWGRLDPALLLKKYSSSKLTSRKGSAGRFIISMRRAAVL